MKSLQRAACSFFHRVIKWPCVIGAGFRWFFPHSTLSDCVFVSLTVKPFVVGIKACRELQDLIGNLGEKKGKKALTAAVLY